MKGYLIAFEGIDGSGKSTQIRRLAGRLRELGWKVYETHEPTDSPFGSLIHQIMTGRLEADKDVLAPLFLADRLDHVTNPVNGIRGKLEDGYVVLCDRYWLSSVAYNSSELFPESWVRESNEEITGLWPADLHILLDLSPDRALERLQKARGGRELFESKNYLAEIRQRYLRLFLGVHEPGAVVDARGTEDTVADWIWDALCRNLPALAEKIPMTEEGENGE